ASAGDLAQGFAPAAAAVGPAVRLRDPHGGRFDSCVREYRCWFESSDGERGVGPVAWCREERTPRLPWTGDAEPHSGSPREDAQPRGCASGSNPPGATTDSSLRGPKGLAVMSVMSVPCRFPWAGRREDAWGHRELSEAHNAAPRGGRP